MDVLRRQDVVVQDIDRETMVYDPVTGEFHLLNPLAAFVFEHSAAKTTLADILASARTTLDSGLQRADILVAVSELDRVSLLDRSEQSREHSFSRRAMVQRLAAAAVLAVPMITTMAAPAAAMAVSPCNQGVGNGPEGCDPGNSNQGDPARSNDERGGIPGAPGRQGGNGK